MSNRLTAMKTRQNQRTPEGAVDRAPNKHERVVLTRYYTSWWILCFEIYSSTKQEINLVCFDISIKITIQNSESDGHFSLNSLITLFHITFYS